MKVELVQIDSLKPDPNNARVHPEANLEVIRNSLKQFKQQRPLLVDKDGVVVAGNGTLAAAKSLGWETIAITRTELDGQDKAAYALIDNRSALMAEWDDGKLAETLKSLNEDGWDIPAIGFDLEGFFKPHEMDAHAARASKTQEAKLKQYLEAGLRVIQLAIVAEQYDEFVEKLEQARQKLGVETNTDCVTALLHRYLGGK